MHEMHHAPEIISEVLAPAAATERRTPARIPRSTYRLQFHRGFRFADATAIVPYLASLGITDCYSSPSLTARSGSTHGYDIIDHNRVNPEIGDEAEFDALAAELARWDMGLILDFVPNHMGIDPSSNRWWRDVLENGPSSPYARFFDVDWSPVKPELRDKVLLPILGDQYGAVLERGELRLELTDGALGLRYFEHDLPVNPRRSPKILRHRLETLEQSRPDDPDVREFLSILTALQNLPSTRETDPERIRERRREKEVARERLARLVASSSPIREHVEAAIALANGEAGKPASFDLLHELLETQAYRLAYWRTAFHEINYRRFFDVNDLGGLRAEDPEVFEAIHGLVFRWIREGKLTGLRLDHIDGLYDPSAYLEKLQQAAGPLYVVVEKILSAGERLPEDWACHGTSGYDFLNDVAGLFVDGRNAKKILRFHQRFTSRTAPFPIVTYVSKRLITNTSMASELNVLAYALNRLSESDRRSRDFTLDSLRDALREVVACFPIYRTYVSERGSSSADRQTIEAAVEQAMRRNPTVERSIFDFIRRAALEGGEFSMKLQQYTGPVQAKGLEDTAFYRFTALASLCEVGGDPQRFGRSPAEFHAANLDRCRSWPLALLATSTHDTKRGEDARMRVNALSELPDEWRNALTQWSRVNASNRARGKEESPDRNDEALFYQSLLAAWPPGEDATAAAALVPRLRAYMEKAIREAKLHTSWTNPNPAYEDAVGAFVEKTLVGKTCRRFFESFLPFAARVAGIGMVSSLAQLVLKIASPGVPDFYQGSELWDLSLVDPDNRCPVDFALRRRMLEALEPLIESEAPSLVEIDGLLESWHDARIKLFLTARALRTRRACPGLFLDGDYVSLEAEGDRRDSVVAFARQHESASLVTIAPRLVASWSGEAPPLGPAWGDTRIELPEHVRGRELRNVLTGERVHAAAGLSVAEAFATLPVALFVSRP